MKAYILIIVLVVIIVATVGGYYIYTQSNNNGQNSMHNTTSNIQNTNPNIQNIDPNIQNTNPNIQNTNPNIQNTDLTMMNNTISSTQNIAPDIRKTPARKKVAPGYLLEGNDAIPPFSITNRDECPIKCNSTPNCVAWTTDGHKCLLKNGGDLNLYGGAPWTGGLKPTKIRKLPATKYAAPGFLLSGNDVIPSFRSTDRNECPAKCASTPNCVAWTTNGETCWLKGGGDLNLYEGDAWTGGLKPDIF